MPPSATRPDRSYPNQVVARDCVEDSVTLSPSVVTIWSVVRWVVLLTPAMMRSAGLAAAEVPEDAVFSCAGERLTEDMGAPAGVVTRRGCFMRAAVEDAIGNLGRRLRPVPSRECVSVAGVTPR